MNPTDEKTHVITVAVVDDDVNILAGLKWLLSNVVNLRCSGAYSSLNDAAAALAEHQPDILLLDVNLRVASGIKAIQPLRARFPNMKIIMHSNYDEMDKITRSRNAGASGYVLKNASAPLLYDAIVQVHRGESVWPAGYNHARLKSRTEQTYSLENKFLRRISALFKARI